MGLGRWLSKNWANTTEPSHPDLAPLELPGPVADAVQRVKAAVAGLPRWAIAGESRHGLHLTRTTRVFRFTDDVRLTFTSHDRGTSIHAESRSRVGKGDLGQNRRNILELWRAVRTGT
jgi:uncharacterized protein (DUF1499 family)